MAGVVDLYSPRIAQEGENQRFKTKLMADTFGDAAKMLFEYSINKQMIDKAYAEIEANAEAKKQQNKWDDLMKRDELAGRQYAKARLMVAEDPTNQEAINTLEEMGFLYSGVRKNYPTNEQGQKVIPPDELEILRRATIDPKTGSYTTEGLGYFKDLTKMETPTGQLLGDWKKLTAAGYSNDSPQVQAIRDQLGKTSVDAEAGRYLQNLWDTEGPEAAIGVYEYWKTLSAPKGSSVSIKMPEGGERKEVVGALMLRKKAERVRALYNSVKTKYSNVLNTPTGVGAEFINGLVAKFGDSDTLITTFQKAVNDYQNTRIRVGAGLTQSENETYRQLGGMLSGGATMKNDMDQKTFETTMDLNYNQDSDALTTILEVQSGYGLKTPPLPGVPEPPGNQPGTPSKASGTEGAGNETLQQLQRRRDELRRKREGKEGRKGRGGLRTPIMPPVSDETPEPGAMLFNRALERQNAVV